MDGGRRGRRASNKRMRDVEWWRQWVANHHALQRPARADNRRADHRLHPTDRHQGEGPKRRRGRTHRADRARGLQVAGRRLLHRELPMAGAARPAASPRADRRLRARASSGNRQRRHRRLDRGVGPGVGLGLQHRQADGVAVADVGTGARRPAVEGQARACPVGDRLLADREFGRQDLRRRQSLGVAQGAEGNAGPERQRPRQRDDRQPTSTRAPATWG